MARALDPVDGDAFDPTSFTVHRASAQIVVTLKTGADEIAMKFDNHDQLNALLRDIRLQAASLGNNL